MTLNFQAVADLDLTTEFVTVNINGTGLGTIYVTRCPMPGDAERRPDHCSGRHLQRGIGDRRWKYDR